MRPFPAIVSVLGLILFAVGCSNYVDYYEYTPRPVLAEIPSTQPQQAPPLSVMASVVGVRRENKDQHVPLSVEVRMRLESNLAEPVIFDPRSMSLTNGELLPFGPPILQPAQTIDVTPVQPVTVSAFFPFPPGRSYDNTDMESFQLRWDAIVDGQNVRQVAYFRRVAYPYYGPYYGYYGYYGYPGPFFSSRVVVVHHHH